MKSRFKQSGNVVDPSGGYQQPVVLAARIIAELNRMSKGEKKGFNDPGILGLIGNFAQNKLSPMAGLGAEWTQARQFTGGGDYTDRFGNKKNMMSETAKRFVSIFSQDMWDVMKSDPSFAEAVGIPIVTILGAGEQNYPERQPKQGRSR
jgi:hypothetical protein